MIKQRKRAIEWRHAYGMVFAISFRLEAKLLGRSFALPSMSLSDRVQQQRIAVGAVHELSACRRIVYFVRGSLIADFERFLRENIPLRSLSTTRFF